MNTKSQQEQTKVFFERNALEWFTKAKSHSRYSVNVIKQRNQYVENISSRFLHKNAKILDVGCGTGDLVINLLKKRYDAYGIDFASNMIRKARSEARKQHFSIDRFFINSFFKFTSTIKYNLISANGFIEYISEKKFESFIKKSYQLLENKGLLVIGSRNRLFNIFSFNNYTRAEIESGNINKLLNECILFNCIKRFEEVFTNNSIPKISRNLKRHEYTGIKVQTRYQYTPCQIINKLHDRGFVCIDLIPINIHVLTTGAKIKLPKIHDQVSNYLQDRKDVYMQMIPQSSSFMITARKI